MSLTDEVKPERTVLEWRNDPDGNWVLGTYYRDEHEITFYECGLYVELITFNEGTLGSHEKWCVVKETFSGQPPIAICDSWGVARKIAESIQDALLAQKCELIERVTRLFKTAEAERQREMGPDTSAVGKMHAYLKVLRLLESDDVLPLQHVTEQE